MMSSKLLNFCNVAILAGLLLAPSFVLSADGDELYSTPDVSDDLMKMDATSDLGFMDPVDADNVEMEASFDSPASDFELSDSVLDEDTSSIANLLVENDTGAMIKDVIVVLDNSGSMKKNDPDFLVTSAVSEFISNLDTQTRIAIVIFDQNVGLTVPLTQLSFGSRDRLLASLEKVNYKGLFTDSPAAIERAIYELKNNGRKYAQKSIVFITDGIVDTGKPEVDLEKSKWLREDLAAEAADESIKVFGIAFTEGADFQLIQSLSQKTDGEYYRALEAADLQKVFRQINVIINEPPEVKIVESAVAIDTAQTSEPAAVIQQPVIIEMPTQVAQGMSKEERLRSTIMMVAAAVLFITLLAIVYLMLRRGRNGSVVANEVITEAYINDTNNYTASSQYRLGQKPTMFGRVAGKDTEHLNFLVIPESTIGRRHAIIEYKDYGFWISDQGSINGTFVNDVLSNSEVCLKHGDKIRLHKFEFEFMMPEMDDAGMTVVSNTTYAAPADNVDAATVLKGSAAGVAAMASLEPEFDITGGVQPETEAEPEFNLEMDDDDIEDETLIRDDGNIDELANETDPGEEAGDDDETIIRDSSSESDLGDGTAPASSDESEDETIIPGAAGLQADQSAGDNINDIEEESMEDETLMRGSFDAAADEEMTIRKEVDEALGDFFDIDGDK